MTTIPRILVVDDEPGILQLVRGCLEMEGFEVDSATSGEAALDRFDREPADLVITDVRMPGMDGVGLIHHIRQHPEGRFLTVLAMSASHETRLLHEAIHAGADEMLSKPFSLTELCIRVRSALQRKRLIDRLDDAEGVLSAMARTLESRDPHTGDHCDRLRVYAVHLGRALGLERDELHALRRGAVLHDIGKIAIPDAVLMAPRRLTPEEWALMKTHPAQGETLCRPLRTMRDVLPIIRHHHERWDGSGYPDGLSGEAIPRLARVFQIVDVFDALTSRRPYKEALTVAEALAQMQAEEDRGWTEPGLVAAWRATLAAHPEVVRAIEARLQTESGDRVVECRSTAAIIGAAAHE